MTFVLQLKAPFFSARTVAWRRGRHWEVAASLLLACMMALAGCGLVSDSEEESDAVTETIIHVQRGTLSITVSSAGNVTIGEKSSLRFGVAGRVADVAIEQGDAVREGQVLARLEAAALETAVVQVEANLAAAQDTLEKHIEAPSESDVTMAEDAVTDARTDLDNARADRAVTAITQSQALTDAQRAYDEGQAGYRFELRKWYGIQPLEADILDPPSIILTDYTPDPVIVETWPSLFQLAPKQTEIHTDVDLAWRTMGQTHVNREQAMVQQAKALAAANRSVTQAVAALEQTQEAREDLQDGPDLVQQQLKEAALSSAAQALVDAQEDLARITLIAPFDGVVAEISIELGDTVGANAAVMVVANPGALEVTGMVDEVDILRVRVGQEARITLTALGQLQIPGVVEAIDLLPRNQSGVVSYEVTMGIRVPRQIQLREGMTVTATIVVEEREDVLLIPAGSVQRDGLQQMVVVVLANGSRESRLVTIGLSDGVRAEVLEGLTDGEQVAVPATAIGQSSFFGRGFGGGAAGFGGGGLGGGGGGFRPGGRSGGG